jgi:hypothetical protein
VIQFRLPYVKRLTLALDQVPATVDWDRLDLTAICPHETANQTVALFVLTDGNLSGIREIARNFAGNWPIAFSIGLFALGIVMGEHPFAVYSVDTVGAISNGEAFLMSPKMESQLGNMAAYIGLGVAVAVLATAESHF